MPPSGTNLLVARDAELAALDESLDAAQDGFGAAVGIIGPAGIGKTELLNALTPKAERREMTLLWASGGEQETDLAFGVALDLLAREVASHGNALRGAAATSAPLFEGAEGERAEPNATARGLFWLVVNLSERAPVLIAVDDAHWADPASVRFLVYLARRISGLAVALVFAARPAEPGTAPARLAPLLAEARIVEPAPLTAAGARELVGVRFPGADDAFVAACHGATAGNPFLLEQLFEELERVDVDGSAEDVGAVDTAASRKVATWLHDRLRSLGANAVNLARAIAVLGPRASLAACRHVAGVPPEEFAEVVSALVRARILDDDEESLRFVHPLVRSSLLETLTAAERSALHDRAAHFLIRCGAPPETIAVHLLRAAPGGRGETVTVLRRAAARASAAGAPDEAAAYLARAFAEPPSQSLRAEIAHELGVASAQAGHPDAADRLETAFELADTADRRAAAALDLGRALLLSSRAPRAIDVLEATLAEQPAASPVQARLESELLVNSQSTVTARRRLAGHVDRLWERREQLGKPHELPLLAILASEAALTRTAEEAANLAERALADGVLLQLLTADAPHHQLAATALVLTDRFGEAERAMAAAIEDSRRRGSVGAFALVSTWRAWARVRRGDLVDAEADAQAALAALDGNLGTLISLPVTVACLLETALELGTTPPEDKLPRGGSELESGLFQPLTVARARWAMERREPEVALRLLASCRAWSDAWGSDAPAYIPWRSLMAEAHLQLGESRTAAELANAELQAARRFGSPGAVGRAARVAGMAAASLELLEDACAALAVSGARLEHGRAMLALGSARRRAGARQAARETLRGALDLATACGARRLEEHVRGELSVAGAKPRRPRTTGRDALTPAELRVARAAADGMANRDIAQDLFVSIRTVEMHLSNAYRKLAIAGRHELPDALTPDEAV